MYWLIHSTNTYWELTLCQKLLYVIRIHQRTDILCFTLCDCNLYFQAVYRNKNPCTLLGGTKMCRVIERPSKVSGAFCLRKLVSSAKATIRRVVLYMDLPQRQSSVFQLPYSGSVWTSQSRAYCRICSGCLLHWLALGPSLWGPPYVLLPLSTVMASVKGFPRTLAVFLYFFTF